VIGDLEQIKSLRKSDGISIAGGEPLLYPHIEELVRYIAGQGWKPVIITNGTELTPERIASLEKAGLVAFTVHVDSHQRRPGWEGCGEADLNQLRSQYADMIHEAGRGRIGCAFNATIYRDTLADVPILMRWGQENIQRVQSLVFILFRLAKVEDRFDYVVRGRKLGRSDAEALRYQTDFTGDYREVMSEEVVAKIEEACPTYQPAAFLNSNQDAGAPKWLLALRVGRPERILGYLDGRIIEMGQVLHHLAFGTYLAYLRPWATKWSQTLLALAPISGSIRRMLWRWLSDPLRLALPLYGQSLLVLQPPDVLPDGRQAMCDGCPDAIYHQGRLMWKCRLEEVQRFGDFVQCVPRRGGEEGTE
jgi:hypothetical protein